MRKLLTVAVCVTALAPAAAAHAQRTGPLLDNARVRVLGTRGGGNVLGTKGGGHVGTDRRPGGVVIRLDTGDASWADDPDAAAAATAAGTPLVLVEPMGGPSAPAPPSASAPGGAAFSGMSFTTLFENDKVRVIRARMEVGAREAFHTHASDTIVVHLSGGEIEDTADGKTVVNRWKPGDVEFEARGSSHSARNAGGAIDVVLVALK
jgi:quercetin dioxygenase-like cupin family protein